MCLAKTSLEIKRKGNKQVAGKGFVPLHPERYLPNLNNHFSTIGVNGLNEAILNFTGGKENIVSQVGTRFCRRSFAVYEK